MNRRERRAAESRDGIKGEALDPADEALFNQALQNHRAGNVQAAERLYREILSRRPRHADSLHLLGVLAGDFGNHDEALKLIGQAIRIKPDVAFFHNSFGNVISAGGDKHGAIDAYRRALALDAGSLEARANLASALRDSGRLVEAKAEFERCLAAQPDMPELHNNYGLLLKAQGKYDEALKHYTRARALRADYPDAEWNEFFVRALTGDLATAWKLQEARWKMPGVVRPTLPSPEWDGSDLTGKTILLFGEQGLGDSIQFIRYAPLVKARGGKVILACPPVLSELMRTVDGIDRVVSEGEPPPHDCHAALLSLPRIFGTTLEAIPAQAPYINADTTRVAAWRDELSGLSGLKVGVVWRGRPTHANDLNRSMKASLFKKILNQPAVSAVVLQKDAQPKELKAMGVPAFEAGPRLESFADTAALIEALDLVVSVDTSVCHLAGALGKPIWVLLPFAPDWRWLLDRADTPWYPSMRLFRQPAIGDWDSVIAAVANALEKEKAR